MLSFIKKGTATVLAVLMLISLLAGCSGGNEEANGNEDTSTSVPQSDENDSPTPVDGIYSWVSRAYTKNMKNGKAPETLVTSAEVHMARNETEGVQFSFTSDRRRNGYKLKTEDSYAGISVEMFRLYFVQANGKNYPDPIAPSEGVVSFSAGETRSILVNFITTAEAEAGEYKYTFELHDKEDKLVMSYDVTVKVYDIVYPETPTLDTAFGIELRSIAYSHGVIDGLPNPYIPTDEEFEAIEEIYLKYYEYMLDHKISPITLPYDILDPRADKYMSDPRWTAFCVPSNVSDETLAAIYAKLRSNPEWLSKAYIYPIDEPTNKQHLDMMLEQYERYKRLCPDIKMATSFFVNVNYDSSRDQLQVMGEILDILCSKISNWDEKKLGWSFGIAPHPTLGSFADRMHGYQAQGKELWSYVCWEPQAPYLNLLLTDEGLDHRLIFWQQYTLGTTGFLYWSVNCYGHCRDPWKGVGSWLGNDIHGDGILLYPGSKLDIDGPVGSLRFEACRDGVEDHEIMVLAEQLLGKDYIDSQIAKIVKDITEYTESDELFEGVRAQIMADVEKALYEK